MIDLLTALSTSNNNKHVIYTEQTRALEAACSLCLRQERDWTAQVGEKDKHQMMKQLITNNDDRSLHALNKDNDMFDALSCNLSML